MTGGIANIYDLAGGAAGIRRLVEAFYDRVEQHPVLRPLFPDDLSLVREKQYLFLTQFFGGPPLYSQQYGAPMLRARHLHVTIEPRHASAWLECMSAALEETVTVPALRNAMLERLTKAAHHMVNHGADGRPLTGTPVVIAHPREGNRTDRGDAQ